MRRHLAFLFVPLLSVPLLWALSLAAPSMALAQKAPQQSPPQPGPQSGPRAPGRPAPVDRQVNLINRSDTTLLQVYIFVAGQGQGQGQDQGQDQGSDRLGADVVQPGRNFLLRLGRVVECRQTLRAVWEDQSEESRMVDLCTQRDIVLNDENRRDVQVQNDTDAVLTQIFIFERGGADPGPDRLGAATLAPNDGFRIRMRGMAACRVTVRAAFTGLPAETREADICAEPRLAFGDATVPLREVTVTNRSNVTLQAIFASAIPAWGADRLGDAVLEPGQSFPMRIRSAECRMRVRAVFQNRREEVRDAVDICAAQPLVFLGARRMALGSSYGRPIQGIYLSPVESADWGANMLAAPLTNGGTTEIGTDGGCQADLRIVFDNSAAEELRGFDMCRNAAITLRPGWVTENRP